MADIPVHSGYGLSSGKASHTSFQNTRSGVSILLASLYDKSPMESGFAVLEAEETTIHSNQKKG
jgi:hypothetical protein